MRRTCGFCGHLVESWGLWVNGTNGIGGIVYRPGHQPRGLHSTPICDICYELITLGSRLVPLAKGVTPARTHEDGCKWLLLSWRAYSRKGESCSCHGIPQHGSKHPMAHAFSDSCSCCRDVCDGSGIIGGKQKEAK